MSDPQNQLIGVTMFARIFGKSEDAIRDLERRGIITAVRDSANRRQFGADQVPRLIAYFANQTPEQRARSGIALDGRKQRSAA